MEVVLSLREVSPQAEQRSNPVWSSRGLPRPTKCGFRNDKRSDGL